MSTTPDITPPPGAADAVNWAPAQRFALIAAAVGLGAFVVLGFVNLGMDHENGTKQFFLSYLVGFIYWSGITLGAMALLMIHYLAKSSWGRILNRTLEASTRCLPLVAVLFVPVVIGASLGKDSPYWWAAPEHTHVPEAKDEKADASKSADPGDVKREERIKYGKELIARRVHEEEEDREHGTWGFLSLPLFIGCGVVYFAIWGAMIFFLNKWGRETIAAGNDRDRIEAPLEKAKNLSGPGLIIYAITLTAMASQWVMSLEPSWASTMFPVIFAVDQFLAALTFSVAIFLTLAHKAPFTEVIKGRQKFQLDMGSFMLALTLFWSYTSFSQMMLVWIGNLPEEIPFYLKRSVPTYGFWWFMSAVLIVFNFACPFILLLFRDIKLHRGRLRAMALWLLAMYAVNVIWWVEPSAAREDGFPLYLLMDIAAIAGVGGVWGLVFLWQLKQRPIVPANQEYMLPEGHAHEHH